MSLVLRLVASTTIHCNLTSSSGVLAVVPIYERQVHPLQYIQNAVSLHPGFGRVVQLYCTSHFWSYGDTVGNPTPHFMVASHASFSFLIMSASLRVGGRGELVVSGARSVACRLLNKSSMVVTMTRAMNW